MGSVVGLAWFEDEATYRRALEVFTDPESLPASYAEWQSIVARQRELIASAGNVALRADIDPERFVAWCAERGLVPNSQGRIAFVDHVVLRYQQTGEGTLLE